MNLKILQGDCRDVLKTLPDASAQTCVTSPPYWGLRAYLAKDHPLKHLEIGQEKTPELYVATMVAVFREVKRVLRPDGTLWLNLGDSYAVSGKGGNPDESEHSKQATNEGSVTDRTHMRFPPNGLKAKDLVGIPWRVAFALQADGWYLRSDIIWHKRNCMPESVTDRPTRSHEYIFLLSKSAKYFYDNEAIKEPSVSDHDSGNSFKGRQGGAEHLPMSGGGGTAKPWKRNGKTSFRGQGADRESQGGPTNRNGRDMSEIGIGAARNKRSVWSVASHSYKGSHFATFPPDLIKPCIMAGCPSGGTVLDPFGGSGTTGEVALEFGRHAILIELNDTYLPLIRNRTDVTPGLLL